MKVVFVFGSNQQGIHGAGAAKYALVHYGAKYGVGEGRTGDAYALPTKETPAVTRSLDDIQRSIEAFLEHAQNNPDCIFFLTPIGTGLAGYSREEILERIELCDRSVPRNVTFTKEWFGL